MKCCVTIICIGLLTWIVRSRVYRRHRQRRHRVARSRRKTVWTELQLTSSHNHILRLENNVQLLLAARIGQIAVETMFTHIWLALSSEARPVWSLGLAYTMLAWRSITSPQQHGSARLDVRPCCCSVRFQLHAFLPFQFPWFSCHLPDFCRNFCLVQNCSVLPKHDVIMALKCLSGSNLRFIRCYF